MAVKQIRAHCVPGLKNTPKLSESYEIQTTKVDFFGPLIQKMVLGTTFAIKILQFEQ